jgi:hypothetical protein
MLLSEWRKTAPNRECMSNKVLDVLKPVLADLGADGDPGCWVIWGEDPEFRYSIMAPTPAGLATIAVRLSGAGEGPRATGKLVRWAKLQVSELSVEASGGIRIVAVQVEGQVLKGMDEEAGKICEFVRGLLAGIDGRAWQASGPIVLSGMPQVAALPKAAPAGKAAARMSGAKGPGAKPQAAWVASHPIPLPAARALPAPSATPAAKPATPKPAAPEPAAPAAAAHKPQDQAPTEPGSVWEVSPPTESFVREAKRPRTWTP